MRRGNERWRVEVGILVEELVSAWIVDILEGISI